jgi:hypothetical protein
MGFKSFFAGQYYSDINKIIQDGVFGYIAFGVITVHIQPFGPTMQHLQERQSVRYWGSRLLPKRIYNSIFGMF